MKHIGNTIKELDVGKMVKIVMFEQGINKARLSRMLKRNATGVKVILDRTSIQTYLVWELSIALNHNFFADLAQKLNAATEGKLEAEQTQLQQLKQENTRLKEERDYLRKAVDLLAKTQ